MPNKVKVTLIPEGLSQFDDAGTQVSETEYATLEEAIKGYLLATQVLATDLVKPYKQGFNPETGDILVVCSPEDVREALALERMVDGDDEVRMTVTREKAIELMKANEEALTYAYHHGWNGEWEESIQDVLGDQVSEADLTEVMEEQ